MEESPADRLADLGMGAQSFNQDIPMGFKIGKNAHTVAFCNSRNGLSGPVGHILIESIT
jgi:hypothetical protein